jgi:hypothetical protein
MDLELFTPETCPTEKAHYRGRPAHLSVSKTGVFQISSQASEKLQLSDGDSVIISNDKKDPENWYLGKSVKKSVGWPLRPVKANKAALQFNSVTLARKMREALGVKQVVAMKLMIAGQPTHHKASGVTFYGLLLKPII